MAFAALLALGLSGCVQPGPPRVSPFPEPRPIPVAYQPSANSLALARYYHLVERSLLTQGLLRTDGGGVDTPYTGALLSRNFLRLAFYNEYSRAGDVLQRRENATTLSRWERPVRLSLHFGPSVDDATRTADQAFVRSYAARLKRVSNHPVSMAKNGNFRVYVLDQDELQRFAPELRRILPSITPATLNAVVNMPRENYCVVIASDASGGGTFDRAVAVIRAEQPTLMRKACYHEEIAQGLGLSNDSPQARPSIFNDDEEFGLLTTHDELLLQMLYDPRLWPGMSGDEALPIVNQIAVELTGGGAV
ncbi:DUF2927 domain-containing protein [Aliiroseovarius sp. KMU-50]|uniref:DUF2927 domain-containing protein n=1 Tax=Aliiroseovarius salicola TaxID=3009082 RepID=A0ABT4W0Z4_9RHOB|nr:DUF2927 domain-containing protein [Aliiroseovarius sp. KMU-50]MDA5093497.1 DUF2927 domain-containing protein [Aliiroseovarius sp. KMU-50]